jgi:DNA-binding response OmpR family regulator
MHNLVISEDKLEFLDLKLDLATKTAWQDNQQLGLYPKEFDVLEYLFRHLYCVVSREELLEQVWKKEARLITDTVYNTVNTLRRKLGERYFTPVYIETIAGQGYKLGVSPRAAYK